MMPASNDITGSISVSFASSERDYTIIGKAHTRLGEKQAFFNEERDQSEEGDKAAQSSADNVEVANDERRHIE